MTELSVGIALLLASGTADHPAHIGPILDAVESDVWTRPLRYFSSIAVPGEKIPRRAGVIRIDERRAVLREQLAHPNVYSVSLTNAPNTRSGTQYAKAFVETQALFDDRFATVTGRQWLPTLVGRDGWVDVMLKLAEDLGAEHGVLPVMASDAVSCECELIGLIYNDVLQHPYPDEFQRMRRAQRELGDRYVRFPRWGTIYARHHVEVLGGVDRIREVVRPAIVREFGTNAWYFQLTDSVATAMSGEALERQRRFTEIAEPLLPPPVRSDPM